MSTDITRYPVAGDPPDPGRYLLNGSHQWVGEKHRPANAEPQLGARLAVGADSGRIVVRRPRDQPWTEHAEDIPQTETGALLLLGFQRRLCHFQTSFDRASNQKGPERFSEPVVCGKMSNISAAVAAFALAPIPEAAVLNFERAENDLCSLQGTPFVRYLKSNAIAPL